MKTLSDHPGLIGRLIEADARRRRIRALPLFRRAAWQVQWICSGLFRWLIWPFVKFVAVPTLIGLSLAAVLLSIFAR